MKINKCLFFIVILFSLYTLYTNAQIKSTPKTIYFTADHFTFFEPIFIHENPDIPRIVQERYEVLMVEALDSLFKIKPKFYRVNEIFEYKKTIMSNDIVNDITHIFNSARTNNRKVSPSSALKSLVQKSNNRYGMFMVINAKGHPSFDGRPAFNNSRLEVIIYDFINNAIVFYDKSRRFEIVNGNYKPLVKNLNKIYKEIK